MGGMKHKIATNYAINYKYLKASSYSWTFSRYIIINNEKTCI